MDKSLAQLAILFADVCGSTRLYEKFGDDIARADMAKCIDLLDEMAKRLDGSTLKTIGDEIMCAFEDPIKASLAAAEMHAALKKACESGEFQMGELHIKIGWHWGNVSWRGEEVTGEAPITAQQIINRAKADETLTSKQSIDELPPGLFANIHMLDRIEAEAWDGSLDVCKIPWEQSGEETQISSVQMSQVVSKEVSLLLEYQGQEFTVNANNTKCSIGRGRHADLRVNGGFTSRLHAEITYRNGRFNLRDESVNGTIIVNENGESKRLRREEGVISGIGKLGFGAPPDDDPNGVVIFRCK
ncbi:MAG: adenylate/guanylate cyclase domain-containing protein [Pseudomonadota bacterium]